MFYCSWFLQQIILITASNWSILESPPPIPRRILARELTQAVGSWLFCSMPSILQSLAVGILSFHRMQIGNWLFGYNISVQGHVHSTGKWSIVLLWLILFQTKRSTYSFDWYLFVWNEIIFYDSSWFPWPILITHKRTLILLKYVHNNIYKLWYIAPLKSMILVPTNESMIWIYLYLNIKWLI